MATDSRALSFSAVADLYAANRPSYPAVLFDTVEELAGRSLAGARVADVGAGTGIASALLRDRGADVLGVEPGDGMAARFRETLPGVPVVRGDGNALPLADSSCDLVTYAQSWHWTDTERSVPEALRVLRPGGALALWWNTPPPDVPWAVEQLERIEHHCGRKPAATRPDASNAGQLAGLSGLHAELRRIRWSRTVPLDTHLANITSSSTFLVLDRSVTERFLDEERAILRGIFPGEMVEEIYVVVLLVTTTRSHGGRP
ncbi:class I SAM-dependent methyltransferase [Streptomyces sp. NPDC048172]|uniref:class I SAM-dependent methyltransferase n=1 Tax=Streptomyces sp. NPDC048172 TaxID=3365505 RepID=UPI00371DE7B7